MYVSKRFLSRKNKKIKENNFKRNSHIDKVFWNVPDGRLTGFYKPDKCESNLCTEGFVNQTKIWT